MKNRKERLAIEAHFYEGGPVEFFNLKDADDWKLIPPELQQSYYFDWLKNDFRVKEGLKLRAWTLQEFLQHADCWFKIKGAGITLAKKLKAIDWNSKKPALSNTFLGSYKWISLDTLLELYEIYDPQTGKISPCGTEIETTKSAEAQETQNANN